MQLYTMQAITGLGFGGPITGSPSGTIYTPTGTGVITGVQLQDVGTLQALGYYVVPSAGASNADGNGANGANANIAAAAGGASTGGNGNGGVGGAVNITAGAGALANGSGTNGVGGAVNITGGAAAPAGNTNGGDVVIQGGAKNGSGKVGNIMVPTLPAADPHVAGALWANAGVVTVSAG